MKRLLSVVLTVLFIAVLTVPALAHGSRHGGRQAVSYAVCSVEGCVKTGLHTHNGKAYDAHFYGDGHKYHAYCALEDCAVAGYHSHDGVYCFGHTYNDGHDYHDYCDTAGCALTGYHEHGGAYCFGHTANDGHSYHRARRGCH